MIFGNRFFSSPEDANSCSKCLKMRHRFCVPKPFGAPKIHISSSKVNLHFEFGPQTLATRSTHQFSMPTKFQHHPTPLTYFFIGFCIDAVTTKKSPHNTTPCIELSGRLQIVLTSFIGGVRTNPSGFGVFSETTCSKTEEIKKICFYLEEI